VLTPNREILDADIIVDASFVRSLKQSIVPSSNQTNANEVFLIPAAWERNLCTNDLRRQGIRGRGNLSDWHQTTIYAMGWNLLHNSRSGRVVTFAKHNAQ